jgi:argininosuccinate lyase
MAQAASDPMLLATDLAELLVRKGIPFREAHEVVGKIVGHCTRNRVDLRALTRAELRTFHPAFDAGADELLDLERSVESRSLTGGTARVRVLEALAHAEAEVADGLARLEASAPASSAATGTRGGRSARARAAGGGARSGRAGRSGKRT